MQDMHLAFLVKLVQGNLKTYLTHFRPVYATTNSFSIRLPGAVNQRRISL